ncbi:MAG: hypothetical protein C5B45_00980 [Chlamydiae bacterium]|nr:MAG: hypothetical protein C5B45_00980 [Chlamydiota bacterium]
MTPIQVTNHPDRETKSINFFPSPIPLMRNVNRIALPVIALLATSALPTANAGPITWAACVAACETLVATVTAETTAAAAAASLAACVAGCGPFFFQPTP